MRNHFTTGYRLRYYAVICFSAGIIGVPSSEGASNSLPVTHISQTTSSVSVDNKKPNACSGITVSNLVVASTASVNSGNANDLLLGRTVATTLNGQGGNDCIVGGGGNDNLNGGAGTDVCIGGPGTDTFNASCETQIP